MKNKNLVIVLAVAFLMTAAPLFAHHGISNFDVGKKLDLKATVTDWI